MGEPALNDNVKQVKILSTITGLNREFPRVVWRNDNSLKIFVFLHGLMIWKVMQRNVWSDTVSKQDDSTTLYSIYSLHR